MGKREVGELTVIDLVISIFMAEIAALGFDRSRPIQEILLIIVLLGVLQFVAAFITLRSKKARVIMDGKPSILIYKGVVNIGEMRKQRYTIDDLILQLRMNNITSIFEVDYAILEVNGQLTAFKQEGTLYHPLPIIVSGKLERENLLRLSKTEEWVKEEMEREGILFIKDIYYAAFDGERLKFLTRANLEMKEKRHYRET